MILKRKPKEKKEETLDDLKSKESTYKEGIAGGVTGAVVGGLTAGIGHFVGKSAKNAKNEHLAKIDESKLRKTKAAGIGLIAAGTGLAVGSALARRKVKRKIKEKEDNACTEKK